MPNVTANDAAERPMWFRVVLTLVFPALFVWSRFASGIWQNRWTGFCLGAGFAAVVLVLNWGRVGIDIRSAKYYLGLSIFSFATAAICLSSFFLVGGGIDGFLTFMFIAFGVQEMYMYRWVLRHDHQTQAMDQQQSANHGRQ
jgi:hypothetical protein